MPDKNQVQPTSPEQPEAKPPLRKGAPLVIALIVIVALIGLANISSLISGNKKAAPQSALTMRPSAPNAQQVTSFETQQQIQHAVTWKSGNGNSSLPRRCSSFSRSRAYRDRNHRTHRR